MNKNIFDVKKNTVAYRIGDISIAVFALIFGTMNIFFFKKEFIDFKNVIDLTLNDDGFNSQLVYALYFVTSGFDLSQFEESGLLILVHVIRLVIATPFYLANEIGGVFGQTIIMYFFLAYVIRFIHTYANIKFLLVLFLLPLFVSWRSVLVMLVVPIFLLFICEKTRKGRWLIISVVLASLSSAALVFLTMASFLLYTKGYLRGLFARSVFGYLLLCFMTGIMILEKITGFISGGSGYDSDKTENPILSMLYRSTFYVKISEGDVFRQLIYILLLAFVLIVTSSILLKKHPKLIHKFYFISLFGLVVEGMGSMIIAMVVLLIISGMTTTEIIPNKRSNISTKKTIKIETYNI